MHLLKGSLKSPQKLLPLLFVAAVCVAVAAPEAAAQRGGHAGAAGGGRAVASGVRAPAPAVVGHAVPRPGYPGYPSHPIAGYPGYPYHPYYPYYRGYYPYYPYYPYYGSGWSIGIGVGFGYGYGYGYPYYYPYGYYGYPYGYPYYPPAGAVAAAPGEAYGGLKIDGAIPDAQVFADGYYVGVVEHNGSTDRLNLQAGVHKMEIRVAGQPPIEFDVNVQPGQTITYHAGGPR
jgi:hypothetical protein